MEVRDIAVGQSPREPGWVRLQADVSYRDGRDERYWLEVPQRDATALAPTGDPWLIWLAPLAATLGEELCLDAPCDPLLLQNVHELQRVWSSWYPHLEVVSITSSSDAKAGGGDRTASFFSGGIDSFYTALTHPNRGTLSEVFAIDDHLLVWGFDIPLSNPRAFERACTSAEQAAESLGRRLVPVITNLRETRFREADWSLLSHGPGLAGVAHALAGAYRLALIPSGAGYHDLEPWGSHPLTDPMMSSARLAIVHDGAGLTRVQKTEFLARHPLASRHLRVCHRDPGGGNCGRCNKCYRTMLALEALGALRESESFDFRSLDLRRAERIYCPNPYDVREFRSLLPLARGAGRRDIEGAVRRTLRRSARRKRLVGIARRFRSTPLLWRWAPAWERHLLRNWIT